MTQKFALTASFESVREAAFGSIGAAYATLGAVLSGPIRVLTICNGTDADVYISTDGTNNHMRIAANSFRVIDVSANKSSTGFYFASGVQFYQKRVSGAPTSGTLWLETIYAA